MNGMSGRPACGSSTRYNPLDNCNIRLTLTFTTHSHAVSLCLTHTPVLIKVMRGNWSARGLSVVLDINNPRGS